MRFRGGLRAGFVLVLLAFAASTVSAEEVKGGQTEVLGYVGWNSNNQGKVYGGGVQIGILPRWLFAGEFGYLPVDSYSHGQEYNFNIHYLFPLKRQEFTPYVLGGLGFQRFASDVSTFSNSVTHVGLNIGGGARWKLGRKWGLRPELKIFLAHYTTARYSIGLFYQF